MTNTSMTAHGGTSMLDHRISLYSWRVFFFFMQYPSIIRAHNLCYTTIVLDPLMSNVEGVEYYEVETSMGRFRFSQSSPGVVPSLLEDLATYRKQAKRDMAACKDTGDTWGESLANARQLAFKITMNSVYGFLGATRGMLPLVHIAASVTATGRAMIQRTKHLVETMVPGSRVIYGGACGRVDVCTPNATGRFYGHTPPPLRTDTDSAMVIFDVGQDKRHDLEAHFQVAERVARDISATFKAPNELEFEKCYYPYLLFSKKRYAGELFFSGDPNELPSTCDGSVLGCGVVGCFDEVPHVSRGRACRHRVVLQCDT